MSKAVSDDDGGRCKRARMSWSVRKGDNADDGDERVAMDCGASTSVGVAKDMPEVPKPPDLLGEDNGRGHKLEAMHKIFLSHSGIQKSFVVDLFDDLMRHDRHAFFDKSKTSLPIGEKFPDLIFKAIEQCEVGVLILSKEFFTRSKWPMLELVAMVEENKRREPNRRIRIIPVYYDIDRDVVCKSPIDDWMKVWREWEEKDRERINAEEWKIALEECCGPTLGLRKREGMLDNRFRALIVEAVCNKVHPETRWDDSHVKGKDRLFTEIHRRIYKGAQPADLKVGVLVVGLYGIGGAGKTTACKILCNELSGGYHDKVCHVEFGSANKEEELLQMVLRKLSDLKVERMEKLNVGECHGYLKTRLLKDRVFVALDNVCDESKEQAKSLLKAKFGDGSVVVVTARSMDQLLRLGVAKENCFGMPDLEREEAKSVLLNSADLKENDVSAEFVKTCLKRCYFSMSSDCEHYHPLALKVLGREVGDMIRGGKVERAVLSRISDFNLSRQMEHPVFSILRSSFDYMREEDQLLFLDIALDIACVVRLYDMNMCTWTEWVCIVHSKDDDELEAMLECLKRRSLLESFDEDWDGDWVFHMHDLWREFATEEMRVGKFGDRRRVYESEEWKGTLDLREYWKLEVVKLTYNGEYSVAVDVRGLKHLRSLEVRNWCVGSTGVHSPSYSRNLEDRNGCIGISEVSGLGTLERLTYLVLQKAASYECIGEVGSLTNLEVVDMRYFRGVRLPDMSKLTSLRILILVDSHSLECINLQNLTSLIRLHIDGCDALRIVDISGCRLLETWDMTGEDFDRLEELNLSSCAQIRSLGGIRYSYRLRRLNITGCSSIRNFDELKYLRKLAELRARDCEMLAMLPECMLPYLRVLDIESVKVPNGVVRESCFPMLELEFEEARALFLSRANLKENDVGEEFVKTCLSRCCFPISQSLASDGKQYAAMAVKVLGSGVGDMIRGGNGERAVPSRISDFSLSRDGEYPLFFVLRTSFDFMLEENDLLFLDIALDMGSGCSRPVIIRTATSVEWLVMVHGIHLDCVEYMVERLEDRSLLKSFDAREDRIWRFHMHELWREFAKEEMKVGKFGDRLWRDDNLDFSRFDWEDLRDEECLLECPKLEAVKLTYYEEDGVAVDVGGLKHLKSLEVWNRWDGTTEVSGLGTVERLSYLVSENAASYDCIAMVGFLTNLQYVALSGFQGTRLPDMSKLTSLRTLVLVGSHSLKCINLQNLQRLSDLYIHGCRALRIVDISGCRSLRTLDVGDEECILEELNLSSCPLIPSLEGIGSLYKLRKLNITGCSSIQKWDKVGNLKNLEELRARDCERLAMLPECTLPNLRVLDIESVKVPNGVVRERCFPMLELEFEEARVLFLKRADMKENDVGEEFVKTCLSRCCFPTSQSLPLEGMQYQALALKVLGSEVGYMRRGGKDERAVLSRVSDFSLSRDGEHSVFAIRRSIFDFMPEEDQLLFLDVALELVLFSSQLEWLCVVHGKNRVEVEDMLDRLTRRLLLDSFGADQDGEWGFCVHGMVHEFAEKMKVGKFGDRRWIHEGKECRGCVDLRDYPKLEVVKLSYDGKDILAVDVRGLKHLRSLEIRMGIGGATVVSGLGTLERIRYVVLWNAASSECIADLGLLANLEAVNLSGFRGDRLPDMSKLTSLRTLILVGSHSLKCINLQNLRRLSDLDIHGCCALRIVDISGCRLLRSLSSFKGLLDMEELNLSSCPLIPSLEGIGSLYKLQKLNITGCSSIQIWDKVGNLKNLEELRARDCERLAMLPECTLPNLRVLDIESVKVPNGVVRERCFPMLELEFEEARVLFLKRADMKENDVGEEFVKTCLSRCCFPTSQSLSLEGMQYQALALKVLGSEVGYMRRGGKDERAVLSRVSDFSLSRDGEHSVFAIRRSIFEFMPEVDQLIFLDVSHNMGSVSPLHWRTSMEWLCMVHGKDRDEVNGILECLKRRSLLESYDKWRFFIHDRWVQFAEEEIRVGKFGDRRRVYQGEVCRGGVDLREYSKMEVVKLTYDGKDKLAVDVRGLKHLRSLEVRSFFGSSHWWLRGLVVSGLGTLESLTYLKLCCVPSVECIAELGMLTSLQYLDLSSFLGDRLPDMSKLTRLRILRLGSLYSLECIKLRDLLSLSDLHIYGCRALWIVDISGCRSLRSLSSFEGLLDLEELNLSSCPLIPSLKGIGSLYKLRKLNITGCSSIQIWDEVGNLKNLEELRARDCERLAMLPECTLPNLQVLDIESVKVPNGVMRERCFPMLTRVPV